MSKADVSPLRQGEVVVWWQRLGAVSEDNGWMDQAASILDEAEQTRLARMLGWQNRSTYILAHVMARGLLTRSTGIAASDWRFEAGEQGKPEVIQPDGLPRLRINISHTQGFAAVAIGLDHDLGVDVEWLGRRAPNLDLVARRVFSERERQSIFAASTDAQLEMFLRFWTLKEAYVKATGKGLAQPLGEVTVDPAALNVTFEAQSKEPARDWVFHQEQPSPEHLLAVAVNAPQTGETISDGAGAEKTAGDAQSLKPVQIDVSPAPMDYLETISRK
ncbi:MAG: 4'-phosphopantetheinyl transferase superfamily protein [Rhodobacteraceae bacterium]|nr:4'-phosphopantetheinyl transferase superfamily protein [Paracoccaceae bacterium]